MFQTERQIPICMYNYIGFGNWVEAFFDVRKRGFDMADEGTNNIRMIVSGRMRGPRF